MYAGDQRDRIPYSASASTVLVAWFSGSQNFVVGNRSNWDVEQDLKKSPLWPFADNETGYRLESGATAGGSDTGFVFREGLTASVTIWRDGDFGATCQAAF